MKEHHGSLNAKRLGEHELASRIKIYNSRESSDAARYSALDDIYHSIAPFIYTFRPWFRSLPAEDFTAYAQEYLAKAVSAFDAAKNYGPISGYLCTNIRYGMLCLYRDRFCYRVGTAEIAKIMENNPDAKPRMYKHRPSEASLDAMLAANRQPLLNSIPDERYSVDEARLCTEIFIEDNPAGLDAESLDAVRMAAMDGMDAKDIAAALGVTVKSAKNIIARAAGRVAKYMRMDVPEELNLDECFRLGPAILEKNTPLNGQQREAMAMRVIRGYTYSDIARRMGLTKQYIHKICSRGLAELHAYMEQGKARM
ncbi:MAG: hypothetical protein LBT92_02555 [Rickettsiales bacterium]|jgi:DNA-directed RNA polymerase specialized sigma24 family protein|nr:hypothetical protein [Rickettsiales bacterium]